NRLSKTAPDLASEIPSLREIIGFRNILSHGYAWVDHSRVWHFAVHLVPELRTTVSKQLQKLSER
ncbi:MAG: DUF86 domain-containing protein, partial [Alphaproteobacteria bacterium]|nr:DUF86 domain-containing protein [Alphaproteobacteria bacterium]